MSPHFLLSSSEPITSKNTSCFGAGDDKYTHRHSRTNMYTHTLTHMSAKDIHTHTHIHKFIHTHTRTHAHTHMHACTPDARTHTLKAKIYFYDSGHVVASTGSFSFIVLRRLWVL